MPNSVHPMHSIAEQFAAANRSADDRPRSDASLGDAAFSPDTALVTLAAEQINAPAFFVNPKLVVSWVSEGGSDRFSRAMAAAANDPEAAHVFRLLGTPAVRDSLSGWSDLFAFVFTCLRRTTARDVFLEQIETIPPEDCPAVPPGAPFDAAGEAFALDSCLLGGSSPLRVYGLNTPQGTLFVLRHDPWTQSDAPADPTATAARRIGHKKSLAVLSLRLDDAHRIADSMLSELFFQLCQRIWQVVDDIVLPLGGIRAAAGSAQASYLFHQGANTHPVFSAIGCACRLQKRLEGLASTLGQEQGWPHAIRMNMGISHAIIDAPLSQAAQLPELSLPGGPLDQSRALTLLCAGGQIWITKDTATQLPAALMQQIVLGVDRNGTFVRNHFTRMDDLPAQIQAGHPLVDRAPLTIARILKIEPED